MADRRVAAQDVILSEAKNPILLRISTARNLVVIILPRFFIRLPADSE
jgi:hypothetical protein